MDKDSTPQEQNNSVIRKVSSQEAKLLNSLIKTITPNGKTYTRYEMTNGDTSNSNKSTSYSSQQSKEVSTSDSIVANLVPDLKEKGPSTSGSVSAQSSSKTHKKHRRKSIIPDHVEHKTIRLQQRISVRKNDYKNMVTLILDNITLKEAWDELQDSVSRRKVVTFIQHKQLSTVCRVWKKFDNVFRHVSTITAAGSIICCTKVYDNRNLAKSLAITSLIMNGMYLILWKSNLFYNYYPITKNISKIFCRKEDTGPVELFVVDNSRDKYCGYTEVILSLLALYCTWNILECEAESNKAEPISEPEQTLKTKLENFFTSLKDRVCGQKVNDRSQTTGK